MKFLLDTHAWIWILMEPARLSSKASRALSKSGTEAWLSPVSTWETLILAQRGALKLADTPSVWVHKALRESGVREATLTHEIAIESRCLELPQGDPADRFIVATAKVMGFVLVTADRKILSAKVCEVLEA